MTDCAFAGQRLLPPCEGPYERHHVCSKRRIKDRYPFGAVFDVVSLSWRPVKRAEQLKDWDQRVSLRELLDDARNLVILCRLHHELLTNHRIYLDANADVMLFADEFGFTAGLEADKRRRVA